MSDLINRQDAIDALECICNTPCNEYFVNAISRLPSAQPVRKRGIWMPIERGDKGYSAGDFICSCCGKPNKCYSVTDYCCSCGAEMKND